MALREVPITRVRGTTTTINCRVLTRGEPANLIGKTIKFAISDEDTMAQVVLKQSGSGITQDAEGNLVVNLAASDLKLVKVPLDRYWWEIRLFETIGAVTEEHCLRNGPFNLKPSPFQ